MENPLKSLISAASKEIVKKRTKDSQQAEPSDSEADKIKKPEMREKFKSQVADCKAQMSQALEDAVKDGTQAINEATADLNEFGTSLGHLSVGTAQFASRIAMIPPAIISATPMGPGVSPNLVAPMLQDLKAEGDNLSVVFDQSYNKRNKLGLDALALAIPSLASILTIHDTVAAITKPLIMLVGASCDGESGSAPEVSSPISYDYKASECSNWSYAGEVEDESELETIEPTVSNCKLYSPIFEDKEMSCNNCKNYR